jgi:hypothetical protein
MGLIQSADVPVRRIHDINYTNGNDPGTVWIKVDRVEIFDAVCSNIIANRTSQTTHYDRPVIDPFYVGKNEFMSLYQKHLDHRQSYETERIFARTEDFWYEEFMQNWHCVWDRLGLTCKQELLDSPGIQRLINLPAPYNYRDVIINYKELRALIIY